jgi:hypothetical protein
VSSPDRSRRRRIGRGLIAFVLAFVLLYAIDGSRQPTSGSGWRILAYRRGLGTPNTVAVLATQAALRSAWDKLAVDGAPESFDFTRAALFWLTSPGSFGCPSRFEGMRIDQSRGIVAGSFSKAITWGCDSQTIPDSFIVAVDRNRLPPGPYRLQLTDPLAPEATAAQVDVMP